jgi:hypothetical protein
MSLGNNLCLSNIHELMTPKAGKMISCGIDEYDKFQNRREDVVFVFHGRFEYGDGGLNLRSFPRSGKLPHPMLQKS